MKLREQAILFLKKAGDDEALLDEVLGSPRVSDEIFGFHCQQAAEKLLKATLSVIFRYHDPRCFSQSWTRGPEAQFTVYQS